MDFEKRKRRALQITEEKGIKMHEAVPPLYSLLWRKGVKIPPPLFAPLWFNSIILGITFAIPYGIIISLINWGSQRTVQPADFFNIALAGGFYGTVMALIYYRKKKKHNFPDWQDLK